MRNKRNKSFAVLLFGVLVAVLMCTVPALAEENLSGTTGPDDHAGLKGEYYDNQDLTNLKLTRTDPKVDFSWGSGSPDPSIGPDTFSVRWSGQVKADHTQTYTFYSSTNDGVRLWVNGQQIINRWSDGVATNTGTISLQAGQWYSITMEYYEGINTASAKLEYSSPSTPRQVVPTDHLRAEAPPDTTAPTVSGAAPQEGATGVAIGANAQATFSEAMDASTINDPEGDGTFTLTKQGATTPVGASVSYNAATKTATLNPNADLEANTTYTATVKSGANGVKDLAGNLLASDKSWSFTTIAGTITTGLKGEYFDNLDFTNLKLTRTDPTVNFDWGSGSPEPSISPETFSVRWTGQVKANYSETYTFYATGDDYVRLYVNGQLVADKWATSLGTATGTIALQAGQWYDIKMEYGASLDNAAAKLEYSSASEPRKVIPQTQLRSPSLGEPPPPLDSAFKREAETMSLPAGASVVSQSDASSARALRFTQAGNATASVTLDQAADRIVVVAKAPQGGSPDLELKVNGVDQLGNGVPVRSTAYADYPVNKALGAGTYNITIRTDAGISPSTPLDVDVIRFEGAGASPPPLPPPAGGSVTGEFKKWHPVTISFNGPSSTETNSSPNPFSDYRLQVSFTSPSGKSFEVPGFYDGDGNGGSSGSVWKVRFNPDEGGTWSYKTSFRQGTNVAIDTSATAGSPTSFDGASGTFDIAARDSAAPGFLSQGLLEYANGHYLKFRDGSYYLKGGADSPENWLGYAGFDNTPNAKHSFSPHVQDWQTGDPTFKPSSADGGKGLIGALNYLSSQGINSIYFLPMNIGGDARDTSPYVSVSNWAGSSANDNYHFDVSKLAQWEQAFAHSQKKGILLHVVLNEAETANKQELDGGTLGNERKLFYREMVARFAHHNALQWNISEEYDLNYNLGSANVKAFAGYIQQVDPYDHPITVHQSGNPDTAWTPFLGDSRFSVTSFQYWNSYAGYGAEVEEWRQKTASAGRPLPIGMDELTPATTTNATDMRKGVLWPTYLSGGNLEWYIGSEDQSLEDFRRYGQLWTYTRHARAFMEGNLPFWEMQPADGLLSCESSDYGGGQVFAKAGEVYAVYLPNASSTGTLDLSGASGSFEKRWYNPRSGAFEGSPQSVSGGGRTSLGVPPSTTSSDWVVLLQRSS